MEFVKTHYEVKDRIAFLTMDYSKNLNAIDEVMADELIEGIRMAEADERVKVVVIASKGKAFSAGGDIGYMYKELKAGGEMTQNLMLKVSQLPFLIKKSKKPFIASVRGAAAGAGCNLAFCCDFIIASHNTKFIQAFANIGLIPDTGGMYILSRIVGASKAAQLAMSARPIGVEEAIGLGMVTEICPDEDLEAKTLEFAQKLAAGASTSYAYIKSLNYEANYKDMEEYIQHEIKAQHACSMTDDFKEGVFAFVEKRTPNFK